jgi:choline dehydrogenase-like flavoprotein
VGRVYVIATHAIEAPKLLLNSCDQLATGVANNSDQVGRNLMDHPLYLSWGLTPQPTYPYRGPLATAGIESLRDGAFRARRAAFRVEFGNEGWNFSNGDPETTTLDFVDGRVSEVNPDGQRLSGEALIRRLNEIFTCQFRFGFLIEQSACADNRVTPSNLADDLGLPRTKIAYNLSDYTKRGFVAAEQLTKQVFDKAGVKRFQQTPEQMQGNPGYFTYTDPDTGQTFNFNYHGSGHIVGTCRMGVDSEHSVVDREQRSWDHPNLFIVGSSVFPSVATGNPSLTIAALALWAADTIQGQLAGGG